MEKIDFQKLTALPQNTGPQTFFFVKSAQANFAEMYLSDNSGVPINIGNTAAITEVVLELLNQQNNIIKVADIAARDVHANNQSANTIYLVVDATADPTVNTGAAAYFYEKATEVFTKFAEFESLDVITKWSDIQNRPSSSVADLDDAVAKRHEHPNLTNLGKIGEDAVGDLTYNNQPVVKFSTNNW